jgi:predicted DCC family thiol-disulfide oxidoreductase YuxK
MPKPAPDKSQAAVVIYDGDCPFCNSYVRLAALRNAVGSVELVDARSADPRVGNVQERGFDLNEGMIAIFGGKIYYGADALVLLSTLSGHRGPFAKLLSRLFSNPERAHRLYPALKIGRRIALKLLGRSQISSH